MRYISLDLETSDLKRHTDNVLTLAMVAVDTAKPEEYWARMHMLFLHQYYTSSEQALEINAKILEDRRLYKTSTDNEVRNAIEKKYTHIANDWQDGGINFIEFLVNNGFEDRAVLAGKNVVGFDLQFLPWDLRGLFFRRALDPGSMYARKSDEFPPDLTECLKRAGMETGNLHDALDDALQCARLINHKLGD